MKICKKCDVSQTLDNFRTENTGYKSPYCDPCRKAYLKKNNQRLIKLRRVKVW